MFVGKNVCHDIKNAQSGIWNGDEYKELFSKYHVKEEKRLHDYGVRITRFLRRKNNEEESIKLQS